MVCNSLILRVLPAIALLISFYLPSIRSFCYILYISHSHVASQCHAEFHRNSHHWLKSNLHPTHFYVVWPKWNPFYRFHIPLLFHFLVILKPCVNNSSRVSVFNEFLFFFVISLVASTSHTHLIQWRIETISKGEAECVAIRGKRAPNTESARSYRGKRRRQRGFAPFQKHLPIILKQTVAIVCWSAVQNGISSQILSKANWVSHFWSFELIRGMTIFVFLSEWLFLYVLYTDFLYQIHLTCGSKTILQMWNYWAIFIVYIDRLRDR